MVRCWPNVKIKLTRFAEAVMLSLRGKGHHKFCSEQLKKNGIFRVGKGLSDKHVLGDAVHLGGGFGSFLFMQGYYITK